MKRNRPSTITGRRAGLALIVMLVALGIVSTICMTLLKMSLAERHQARHDAVASQATWLAESGVELAAVLLKKDQNSKGTTWNLSAEQLGGNHTAIVTIVIAPIESAPKSRQVTVTAEFPAKAVQPVKARLIRFIDL